MRKILYFMLALSLVFFSCKSEPKVVEEPVVEEPVVEEPVQETAGVFVVNCPANMQKVDVLMASKLDEIAESIRTIKPESVTFEGHTAMLDSARQEELASKKEINLIVSYLENIDALDDVKVIVENKGASDPLAPHNDIYSRSKNRRVVITLR